MCEMKIREKCVCVRVFFFSSIGFKFVEIE